MPERRGEEGERAEEPEPGGEEQAPDFEGLLLRAGYNYHVFLAAMFGYLRERAREHGAAAGEFLAWAAERLAPTWSGLQGHGADAVLRVILDNLAATGYPVLAVELGATLSRAEVGAVPLGLDAEGWRSLLAPFGVAPEAMRELFSVFAPLAAAAGASLEIVEGDGYIELTVRREPPAVGPQPVRFFA